MTFSRWTLRGQFAALVIIGLGATTRADEAATIPRYDLKPGLELKYQGTSDFKHESGGQRHKTNWQVWVVRKNDDGSARVVISSSQKFSQLSGGRESGGGQARVTMAYCDVFPDGRIVPNESLGFHLDPTAIFPKLPADLAQYKKGWEGPGAGDDSRTEYKADANSEANSDAWVFEGVRESPMDKVYESTSRSRFFLDRTRRAIRRVESQTTQGYGVNGKGTGTTELVSAEKHDAAWTKILAEESACYFAANKANEALLAQASKDAQRVRVLLSDAETTLEDAREKLTLPILKELVDQQLKNQKRMASYYIEEAKNRDKVIGHAAADWNVKDLDGKSHALKDYRGKVVILDFWYRGCGWCIRAMPQMVKLTDDFKGQSVAVLGMNTDRKDSDAKFVMETMKLNYPALKAEGIPEKYEVRGFPTLIIIDQEGKVADIHVGYSPTLREEVSKSVKAILAKK